ncbi:MAG: glycosyl hydrolase family protein [Sphingobacteriales bacterium]|nr:MAG: glycosyl hydrolase family protein [Sphingobacteriales bacterium]
MKFMLTYIVMPLLALFTSCSKDSGNGGSGGGTPPTNLTLVAVVNPDNSGNVTFTASATSATTYEYDFGNGVFQNVPGGIVGYRYPMSGNYTVKVTAKNASTATISKTTTIAVIVTQAMLWSDEFDVPGAPNPAKWNYDLGAGGWGNDELQNYTSRTENAVVEGGMLKIKSIRESYNGSSFTSARLKTQGKFEFKYGKVEARAKLPAGVGTWAAIWALGSDITTVGWPACGELDIMEHLGREENKIYGTLHYPGRSGGNADGATKMISGATTGFHIYSTEWTASEIKIKVDGELIHSVPTAGKPFNHNFFLIMNLAMGGNFGGTVAPSVNGGTMEVDYIRVYQ